MKQILQHLRTGEIELADVPAPVVRPGHLIVQTARSLISVGSERMVVEFGRAGLIAKARSQPERVRQVLDKIRADGLMPTLETVFSRLDEPLPLGYCNVGIVREVGPGVAEFVPGDRIASNGPHAELVCVPRNLCAKIPDEVDDAQATFTVLASIGLQGIRLLNPTLGEKFVVFGLGLIGLVSVQLLQANGCQVLGVDINPERLALAERFGAQTARAGNGVDPVTAVQAWTAGKGADGVLIAASAKSDELVHQAAQMCRKRGRIVLVGVVGLNLRRNDFYEKELSLAVSCAYGPGRYDDKYEQEGHDYPYDFVRWTAQRNFDAVLGTLRSGRLRVDELITHRVPLAEFSRAYDLLSTDRHALGIVLEYPAEVTRAPRITVTQKDTEPVGQPVIGIIGAGTFSKSTLMPQLSKTNSRLAYIADLNGAAARHLARKYRVEQAVTDYRLMLQDERVDAVIIAVGHNLHQRLICEVLAADKHPFVEKPLAMNSDEVAQILAAAATRPNRQLMIGFNRRFSPHVTKMKQLLAGRREPLAMNMTVNAGPIPPGHWVHDPVRGGGRIIGEACHFIDLLMYLAGGPIRTVSATRMGGAVAVADDKMSIILAFEDGSLGTVNYFANGAKSYPKELLEVFCAGCVLRLDNFRRLRGYGFKGFSRFKTPRQDKGHGGEYAAFVDRLTTGGPPLVPLEQMVNVTLASFAAVTAAREGRTVSIDREYAAVLAGVSATGAQPAQP